MAGLAFEDLIPSADLPESWSSSLIQQKTACFSGEGSVWDEEKTSLPAAVRVMGSPTSPREICLKSLTVTHTFL